MLKDIGKTLISLWSLIVGLKITGKEFFRPWLTVHYPRQEVKNLNTYRGHIELTGQESNSQIPRCIMCGKCAEICPSGCIHIEFHIAGEKEIDQSSKILIGVGVEIPFSGTKFVPTQKIERELDVFNLNYNLCSLCGLCVQNCPADSIRFSKDVYLAGRSRKEFEYDLLERLKKQV